MLDSLNAIGKALLDRLLGALTPAEPRAKNRAAIDLADPVDGALGDAGLLLAFAAQSHRSIDGEKVSALTKAVAEVRASRVASTVDTPETVAALWTAYDALAVEMAPLSAHSIRSSMVVNGKRFPASLTTPTAYNSAAAVVVFVVCLALQGFWVAGKELIDRADALEVQKTSVQQRVTENTARRSRNENKIDTLKERLCTLVSCDDYGEPTAAPRRVADREQVAVVATELAQTRQTDADAVIESEELNEELEKLNERGRPLENLIREWHTRARLVCGLRLLEFMCPVASPQMVDTKGDELRQRVAAVSAKADEARAKVSRERGTPLFPTLAADRDLRRAQQDLALHEADRFRTLVVEARIIVANIGTYLIAMVMGVLGALAFILRTLSQQLRDHTYVPVAVSASIVRVCLGAIAGVFGSLLAPGADATFKTLPPLFVPFVFGYGIEILFALLDRIVRTFAQSEPQPAGP